MAKNALKQIARINDAMTTANIRSPSELARLMDLPRQTIHRWLNDGIDHISYKSLLTLADTLNVNARWLVFGDIGPLKPPIREPWEAEAAEIARALDDSLRKHWLFMGQCLMNVKADRNQRPLRLRDLKVKKTKKVQQVKAVKRTTSTRSRKV